MTNFRDHGRLFRSFPRCSQLVTTPPEARQERRGAHGPIADRATDAPRPLNGGLAPRPWAEPGGRSRRAARKASSVPAASAACDIGKPCRAPGNTAISTCGTSSASAAACESETKGLRSGIISSRGDLKAGSSLVRSVPISSSPRPTTTCGVRLRLRLPKPGDRLLRHGAGHEPHLHQALAPALDADAGKLRPPARRIADMSALDGRVAHGDRSEARGMPEASRQRNRAADQLPHHVHRTGAERRLADLQKIGNQLVHSSIHAPGAAQPIGRSRACRSARRDGAPR